ncbi:unnamed protein product, partial [Cyprideis torosa]
MSGVEANHHETDSEDELPPGWEERASEEEGRVYYVNHLDQKTQWEHPRTGKQKVISSQLPPGWKKVESEDGEPPVFVNESTGQRSYADPRLAFSRERMTGMGDFRQRFDSSSTALQVLHGVDLTGLQVFITGGNCGIGFETARSLALHGARVFVGCRSVERGQAAIREMEKDREGIKVSGS